MRGQAFPERPVLGVWDAKVSTCLFHHLRDRRVVDVTDPREQVMFDLKVQTAEEPRREPAGPGEVHGRFRLMDGPGLVDTPCAREGQGERRLFYAVRSLKHHAQGGRKDDRGAGIIAISLLTQGESEYAWCPPSCCTLNPIPAAANPSRMASGTPCHQAWAANTSSR